MVNFIQMSELLKGLPDTDLQAKLQSPDGTVPPFLLAAEAARRADIRQRFAPKAGQTSVIDDLLSQGAAQQGLGQQANPSLPQSMPKPGVPAMKDGGLAGLRSFAAGGMLNPDQSKKMTGLDALMPDTSVDIVKPMQASGIDKFGMNKEEADVERDRRAQQAWENAKPKTDSILAPDPAAQEKAAALPPKSPEESDDEYRARLEKLLQSDPENPFTVVRGSEWFAASAGFQDTDKTFLEQLANAGQVISTGVEARADARKQQELEAEKTLWDFDFKQHQAEQSAAAEAAKAAETRANRVEDRSTLTAGQRLQYAQTQVTNINKEIENISGEIADLNNPASMFENGITDPKVRDEKIRSAQARLAELQSQLIEAKARQAAIYRESSGGGAGNVGYYDPSKNGIMPLTP